MTVRAEMINTHPLQPLLPESNCRLVIAGIIQHGNLHGEQNSEIAFLSKHNSGHHLVAKRLQIHIGNQAWRFNAVSRKIVQFVFNRYHCLFDRTQCLRAKNKLQRFLLVCDEIEHDM